MQIMISPFSKQKPEIGHVVTSVLENGMTYYVQAHTQPNSGIVFALAVKAGSVLEDEHEKGAAHFVEHMCLADTHYLSKQEIGSIYKLYNINCKAYTNYEETVYMLQSPCNDVEAIEKCIMTLSGIACEVAFNCDRIEEVREDVLKEWSFTQNTQKAYNRNHTLQILLNESRYIYHLPIGIPEQIREFSRETLIKFYKTWYRPELIALIAVGDFDVKLVEETIYRYFHSTPNYKVPPRVIYSIPDHVQPRFTVNRVSQREDTEVNIYLRHSFHPLSAPKLKLMDQLSFNILMKRIECQKKKHNKLWNNILWATERFLIGYEFIVLSVKLQNKYLISDLTECLYVFDHISKQNFSDTEVSFERMGFKKDLEQNYQLYASIPSKILVKEYINNFIYDEPLMTMENEYEVVNNLLASITPKELYDHLHQRLNTVNNTLIVNSPILDERITTNAINEYSESLNKYMYWQ